MPPMVPMIQLLGSGCGQVGSTWNFGTPCPAAGDSVANAKRQPSPACLKIRAMVPSPFRMLGKA